MKFGSKNYLEKNIVLGDLLCIVLLSFLIHRILTSALVSMAMEECPQAVRVLLLVSHHQPLLLHQSPIDSMSVVSAYPYLLYNNKSLYYICYIAWILYSCFINYHLSLIWAICCWIRKFGVLLCRSFWACAIFKAYTYGLSVVQKYISSFFLFKGD